MTTHIGTEGGPLWLQIEAKINELGPQELTGDNKERAIARIAGDLDQTGVNVSKNAGNMLALRTAVDETVKVGRPFLKDFGDAVGALVLEDVVDPYAATVRLIKQVGETWPRLKESARKPDVLRIVEKTRLDLFIARARELSGEEGIRYLIAEKVAPGVIVEALGITQEDFGRVNAAVEAEHAERRRVEKLIEEAAGQSEEEKVKNLIKNDVADNLIVEMAGVDQTMVDQTRQSLEEEMKEKRRLAEEEAARKQAEAEGPPLEAIPPDQLLEYIESVREILEFSDKEDEIRTMCAQSAIPKSVVDVAVSDPARLDELEKNAEG